MPQTLEGLCSLVVCSSSHEAIYRYWSWYTFCVCLLTYVELILACSRDSAVLELGVYVRCGRERKAQEEAKRQKAILEEALRLKRIEDEARAAAEIIRCAEM